MGEMPKNRAKLQRKFWYFLKGYDIIVQWLCVCEKLSNIRLYKEDVQE